MEVKIFLTTLIVFLFFIFVAKLVMLTSKRLEKRTDTFFGIIFALCIIIMAVTSIAIVWKYF